MDWGSTQNSERKKSSTSASTSSHASADFLMVPESVPCFMLDPTKTRQVFYNLLSNAVKYSRNIIMLSSVIVQLTGSFACVLLPLLKNVFG